jgi:hypothetical protein
MRCSSKARNWFWGIFFLAAAVFVIASQTSSFVHVGFWSIAATVLLVALFISGIMNVNFFGIFMPVALLYLIYQSPLGWPAIAAWIPILAAVLASIGCSMIFHPHHIHNVVCDWDPSSVHIGSDAYHSTEENVEGNDIHVKSSFVESCRYLHSDSLREADLETSFGKLGIYFDQVQLSPQGAEAHVNVSFGSMALYVPHTWCIVNQVNASFGAVQNAHRSQEVAPDAPVLTLTGSVAFGNLEIHYT